MYLQAGARKMDWGSYEDAIKHEYAIRVQRIEKLTLLSALVLLISAIWILWPLLQSTLDGKGGILSGFGSTVLLILWGMILQDAVLDDAKARTRIASATTFAFPILAVVGTMNISSQTDDLVASICILIPALYCYRISNQLLNGALDVLRYRAIVASIGSGTGLVILMTSTTISFEFGLSMLAPIVILFAIGDAVVAWFTGDEHKELRKTFKSKLNRLETEVLILKSQGAAVSQASSLITTAGEEGHLDPELGMKLLADAEEEMQRSLSLAADVEIIQNDAMQYLEQAEKISPMAKKPRKAFEAGLREVSLGSLREAEGLFRTSKKRSLELIEWWQKAEDVISEAESLLQNTEGGGTEHLRELLQDAKTKLFAEQPKKAFEFASVIPEQLTADEHAMERASQSIEIAKQTLEQADGLGIEQELGDRLAQAQKAYDEGLASQAVGLSEGIIRTIENEREAMDYTRRAMKQKKNLSKQIEAFGNKSEWEDRIVAIEDAMKKNMWSTAETLHRTFLKDLEAGSKQVDDTDELVSFVEEEWRVLRNQCEASGIGVNDEQRRACEAAVSDARSLLSKGDVEGSLSQLGLCDEFMEKLRRRI
jgi:hypothetical protein